MIELELINHCISRNPALNATCHRQNAYRISLCAKTYKSIFRRRILESRLAKPLNFKDPIYYFSWVLPHLCVVLSIVNSVLIDE
jgi:hypothetical protein